LVNIQFAPGLHKEIDWGTAQLANVN